MMNKVQEKYMMAKATLQTYEEMEADIEKEYIIKNRIVNEDGEIPERVYCIDDMEAFNRAKEEISRVIQGSGLEGKINAAKENLNNAEESIIEFALSLSPEGIRITLENGAKANFTIRQKLIDLAFRLDVSTI